MNFQPGFVLPNTNPLPVGGMNGRVNLSAPSSAGGPLRDEVPGFSYRTTTETSFATDALRGNWEVTELSKAFFSNDNMRAVQNAIRKSVYDKSGSRKYEQVLNWSVPHIMSAVDHYNYYLNDISHMPVPLARSVSLSSAGTKSLPLNPFV